MIKTFLVLKLNLLTLTMLNSNFGLLGEVEKDIFNFMGE